MKIYLPTLTLICLLFLSCNNSANTTSDDDSATTDTNFLGTWVYSNQVPVVTQKDGSMNGSTCIISRVPGTLESYSVDILNNTGILFTKLNDSTLKGVAAKFLIKYNSSNQHIIYLFNAHKIDGMEYYKLK